jgi:hypothetical protein
MEVKHSRPRGRVGVRADGQRPGHGKGLHNRDVIKDEIGGKLPSGRPFRPDVRARPCLPCGRGFTRGRVFTVCGHGKNCVRADAQVRPRGRKKIK